MPDLIVAGAGPAGLATALYAAQAGLAVVVVDPRTHPIDKACGEGLMPPAVAALRALGVEPAGRPFRGIRYLDGRWSAEADFSAGTGLGVRRTCLQEALLDRARSAGVTVMTGAVSEISQDADRVHAAGLSARWLVAADGLHSPMRALVGLDVPDVERSPRWGLRRHYAMEPWSDHVEVHWAARSEAYVTPVADGLVGVAVLSSVRGGLDSQLAAFPALAARLPAKAATKDLGSGPLRQRSRARVSGRVLLVGDAAGYVDALTGEGIAISMACGRELVSALVREEPQAYEQGWLEATRRYRQLTGSLLWARNRRLLRPAIVPLASMAPALFRVAVNQLAR